MTQAHLGHLAEPQGGDGSNGTSAGVDDGLGLMTPGEVASVLHVDPNTVARWSDNGKLRALRTPGGHRRYFAAEVVEIARNGHA